MRSMIVSTQYSIWWISPSGLRGPGTSCVLCVRVLRFYFGKNLGSRDSFRKRIPEGGRHEWIRLAVRLDFRTITEVEDCLRRKRPVLELRRKLPKGATPKFRRTMACSLIILSLRYRSGSLEKRKEKAACRTTQQTVPRETPDSLKQIAQLNMDTRSLVTCST